jgi:hypothetical protein
MFIQSLQEVKSLPAPPLGLLPAIHDATVVGVQSLPTSPEKGVVFRNDANGPINLPATGKWPTKRVEPGEFFGHDGRFLYPVLNRPGTTSFYPKSFDRIVYTFSFNGSTLPVGNSFAFERLFNFRLIANTSLALWSVFFEIGVRDDDVSPDIIITRAATLTAGQKTISLQDISGIDYRMLVTGQGIYSDIDGSTFVMNAANGVVTLSRPATQSGTFQITFKADTGPNIGVVKWLPPIMEYVVPLTDLKSVNPLGMVITNHGEKKGISSRNDIGMEAFWKKFDKAQAASLDSLPETNEFYLRVRLGNFDTENNVTDPRGYVAYTVRAISDPEDKS